MALLRSRELVALHTSGVTAVAEEPQRLPSKQRHPLALLLPLPLLTLLLLLLLLLLQLPQPLPIPPRRCLQRGQHAPPCSLQRRAVPDVRAHVVPRATACVSCAALLGSAAPQKRVRQLREVPARARVQVLAMPRWMQVEVQGLVRHAR